MSDVRPTSTSWLSVSLAVYVSLAEMVCCVIVLTPEVPAESLNGTTSSIFIISTAYLFLRIWFCCCSSIRMSLFCSAIVFA